MSVSVFTAGDGRYQFPPLDAGSYRVRARRIGFDDVAHDDVTMPTATQSLDFALQPTQNVNDQLPPTYFHSLLHWPSARVQGDFARTCANCHQIGDHRWRKPRSAAEWETVVNRMISYGIVPFYPETRELLIPTLAATFSPGAPAPAFAVPPPPAGDATRAVIYEWEIDPVAKPGCHDLELGVDGTVYTVSGMFALNPQTETWKVYPLPSIPRGAELPYNLHVNLQNGEVWINGSNSDSMIRFEPATERFTVYQLPTPGDFTREIEFDDAGNVWTCTSDQEIAPGVAGTGRIIKIEQRERDGICGDGFADGEEECDDGNEAACDGCSAACRAESGRGDGVQCGAETCDDGNRTSCDGCADTCRVEIGSLCGDEIVSFDCDCGEECDPPGATCSFTRTRQARPLGTRHLTFGGSWSAEQSAHDVDGPGRGRRRRRGGAALPADLRPAPARRGRRLRADNVPAVEPCRVHHRSHRGTLYQRQSEGRQRDACAAGRTLHLRRLENNRRTGAARGSVPAGRERSSG